MSNRAGRKLQNIEGRELGRFNSHYLPPQHTATHSKVLPMFQNILGSLTSAVPLLNSAGSEGKAQGGGGLGGIVGQVIAPIASVATTATKTASTIMDQFMPPIAKSLLGAVTGGAKPSDGSLESGLKFEVNILKSVVAAKPMDATAKANIQGALDQVKAGKPLNECLSQLSEQEKTLLADTIGNAGFEPPEALSSYLTDKSQGDSGRMDCALKNVEVAESSGYEATEASAMLRFVPLAGALFGH